jgi:hypothetical protein
MRWNIIVECVGEDGKQFKPGNGTVGLASAVASRRPGIPPLSSPTTRRHSPPRPRGRIAAPPVKQASFRQVCVNLPVAQSHGRYRHMWPEHAVKNQDHKLRVLKLQMCRMLPERLELHDRLGRSALALMQRYRRSTWVSHPFNPEGCACRVDKCIWYRRRLKS